MQVKHNEDPSIEAYIPLMKINIGRIHMCMKIDHILCHHHTTERMLLNGTPSDERNDDPSSVPQRELRQETKWMQGTHART